MFDAIEAPWLKIAVTAGGFVIGALLGGFLANLLGFFVRKTPWSRAAMFRIRFLGGLLTAILIYWMLGEGGFGPGKGDLPPRPTQGPPLPVADAPPPNPPDLEPPGPKAMTIILVSREVWDRAGRPPGGFFAFSSAPEKPVGVEAILQRIREMLNQGTMQKEDRIELATQSESSSSPSHNPEVKILRDKLKEMGVRLWIAAEPDANE